MAEPILCEFLLKLATDSHARDRFNKLPRNEKVTFLKTLGLHDGPAEAVADGNDKAIAQAVVEELQPRGGSSASGPRHTIQMACEIVLNPATHDK